MQDRPEAPSSWASPLDNICQERNTAIVYVCVKESNSPILSTLQFCSHVLGLTSETGCFRHDLIFNHLAFLVFSIIVALPEKLKKSSVKGITACGHRGAG